VCNGGRDGGHGEEAVVRYAGVAAAAPSGASGAAHRRRLFGTLRCHEHGLGGEARVATTFGTETHGELSCFCDNGDKEKPLERAVAESCCASMAAELDLHWKSEWLRYMLAAASASSLVLPEGAEDDGRENANGFA